MNAEANPVGRRSFLRGALAGAGATGIVAGSGLGVAHAVQGGAAAPPPTAVPFHGERQAGILTPPCRHTAVVAFDVIAASRGELVELLRTITERLRFLTTGGTPRPLGITAPPDDSGVLGPRVSGGRLVTTVGVGASLFDSRYGLADRKPARLRPMRTFPNDDLDPARCHGDISLQLCAEEPDVVLHALRDVARHTRGGMQVKWRMDGFSSPPRPAGTPRNLMGFKDGIANPDPADTPEMDQLVWVAGADEPSWTRGGSYQVIRLIRMLVEFWDRVSIGEQETIFGRRRDTGAPLGGVREHDIPHYARDPAGNVIPLSSHIRRANPRTPSTEDDRILRRSYNYDRGTNAAGNLDMGLIFCCYQQDLARQFETVQMRLIDEPLADYISPFGGGYFFVLPGARDGSDYLGRAMAT